MASEEEPNAGVEFGQVGPDASDRRLALSRPLWKRLDAGSGTSSHPFGGEHLHRT